MAATPFERLAASALLLLVGVATCVRCQDRAGAPLAVTQRFLAFADSQWRYDLACTDLTPQPGGDFADVRWQIVTHNGIVGGHQFLLGMWIPPDTIRIDSAFIATSWVLRHELLHHLLRGPPPPRGPHPFNPFWIPCHVMPAQHAP